MNQIRLEKYGTAVLLQMYASVEGSFTVGDILYANNRPSHELQIM